MFFDLFGYQKENLEVLRVQIISAGPKDRIELLENVDRFYQH